MSNDEINRLRLRQMSHDLEDNRIPRSKGFSRHFVLHSLDLMSILNTIFKSKSDDRLIENNKDSMDNKNNKIEEQQSEQNTPEQTNTEDKITESAGGKVPTNMTPTDGHTIDTTKKWKKKLKDIIRNPNISDKDKTEMIVEELDLRRRTEDLIRERRLIPPNKRILGGAGVGTSKQIATVSNPKKSNDKQATTLKEQSQQKKETKTKTEANDDDDDDDDHDDDDDDDENRGG